MPCAADCETVPLTFAGRATYRITDRQGELEAFDRSRQTAEPQRLAGCGAGMGALPSHRLLLTLS
jgi:hypothetical protein